MCLFTYEKPLKTAKGTKNIFVEVLNACKVRFNTNDVALCIRNNQDFISEIVEATIKSNQDSFKIKKGEFTEIFIDGIKYNYFVNSIEVNNKVLTISEKPYTQTTRFLLPSLGNTDNYFGLSKFLLNSYLKFKEEGTLIIQLHYRFINFPAYFKIENNLLNLPNCIGYNSIPNSDIVTIDFYNSKLNYLYEYFKEGKYSYFPDEYKKQIIKFHTKNSQYYKAVLYKDDVYRKQLSLQFGESISTELELHSKPDLTKEFIN